MAALSAHLGAARLGSAVVFSGTDIEVEGREIRRRSTSSTAKVKATQQVAASREAPAAASDNRLEQKETSAVAAPGRARNRLRDPTRSVGQAHARPGRCVHLQGRRRHRVCRATPSKPNAPSSSTGFYCAEQCDPGQRNPIQLTSEVDHQNGRARDHGPRTSPTNREPCRKLRHPETETETTSSTAPDEVTLEDAGYDAQRPDRKYAVMARADTEIRRRTDAWLSLARRRRQLAPPGLHELQQQPRRLGKGRRHHAAVLRAKPAERDAVGHAPAAVGADADAGRNCRRRCSGFRRPGREHLASFR